MSDLHWSAGPAALGADRPILLLAFRGMFDAAGAATAGIEWLSNLYSPSPVATIDAESYFDFQQERPLARIRNGQREIIWPDNEFSYLSAATVGAHDERRSLIVCAGVEPHLRWRSFCANLVDIVTTTRAEMVVTLGAMVGVTPHTRPFPVVGSAANHALASRLRLRSPSYEGPTGVVGTLHELLDRAGIPTISLRATVPHYVPAPPNPKATRALLKRLEDVTRVRTGFLRMDEAASQWEANVNEAASEDRDVTEYVSKLERQFDADAPLPSGDDIASELEAFLREQRD